MCNGLMIILFILSVTKSIRMTLMTSNILRELSVMKMYLTEKHMMVWSFHSAYLAMLKKKV